MGTGDEETRRFFKHSSVQVLLCPRSGGKGHSWAKKQVYMNNLFIVNTGLLFKYWLLKLEFHLKDIYRTAACRMVQPEVPVISAAAFLFDHKSNIISEASIDMQKYLKFTFRS